MERPTTNVETCKKARPQPSRKTIVLKWPAKRQPDPCIFRAFWQNPLLRRQAQAKQLFPSGKIQRCGHGILLLRQAGREYRTQALLTYKFNTWYAEQAYGLAIYPYAEKCFCPCARNAESGLPTSRLDAHISGSPCSTLTGQWITMRS